MTHIFLLLFSKSIIAVEDLRVNAKFTVQKVKLSNQISNLNYKDKTEKANHGGFNADSIHPVRTSDAYTAHSVTFISVQKVMLRSFVVAFIYT